MKKIISFILCITALLVISGCAKEETPETVEVRYSGTFISYDVLEDSQSITIDYIGEQKTVMLGEGVTVDPTIVFGCEITLTVQESEDKTVEYCTQVTLDSVPLRIELGYSGAILMAKESETMYQALLAKVSYSYNKNTNGRISVGGLQNSYYIDQDEKAIYVNVVGQMTENEYTQSWSSMEYTDRVTHERFYLYNYGDWTQSVVDSVDKITFASPESSIEESDFYREGSNLVVEGACSVVEDSYLDYLMEQVFGDIEYKAGAPTITFVAKFVEETKSLFYAEYNVSFDDTIPDGDSFITVENLNIVLTGVDFNNTESVQIPDYVRYQQPVVTEEPVQAEDIKLYESVFGKTAEEVTSDWVEVILDYPHQNEDIIENSDPDELVQMTMDIVLNYNLEEFTEFCGIEDPTYEQQYIINQLTFFAQEGVE